MLNKQTMSWISNFYQISYHFRLRKKKSVSYTGNGTFSIFNVFIIVMNILKCQKSFVLKLTDSMCHFYQYCGCMVINVVFLKKFSAKPTCNPPNITLSEPTNTSRKPHLINFTLYF